MYKIIGVLSIIIVLTSCNGNNKDSDAYGNFEAKEIIVSAEANGRILNMQLEEGQDVKAGDQVGLIDTMQLSLSRNQLFAKKQAVASKLVSIEAQIEVLKEQKGNLIIEKKRVEKLLKEDAATSKQLDEITYNVNVMEKQIYSVTTKKATIRAELYAVENQIKAIIDQLLRCRIINPVDGTILEKYIETYEIVNMGRSIYKIADLSEMELRVYISGSQLPHVKIGQNVKVFIDQNQRNNKELHGKVSWISSKAEFTPKIIQTKEERVNLVYAMKVLVKNDGSIKIGMPGEVVF